jgi:hypothetical protein
MHNAISPSKIIFSQDCKAILESMSAAMRNSLFKITTILKRNLIFHPNKTYSIKNINRAHPSNMCNLIRWIITQACIVLAHVVFGAKCQSAQILAPLRGALVEFCRTQRNNL